VVVQDFLQQSLTYSLTSQPISSRGWRVAITVKNERLCPSVITDKVHLPPSTIPFSVPLAIYVKQSRLGVFQPGSNGVLLYRGIMGLPSKPSRSKSMISCAELGGIFG
jgi:hypothetical protein